MPERTDARTYRFLGEIARTAHELDVRGFGTSFYGNISVLLRGIDLEGGPTAYPLSVDHPDLVGSTLLITRSTSTMRGIASDPEANIGTYTLEDGRVRLVDGTGPPSIELGAHLAIHSRLSLPISAVVHCHIGGHLPRLEALRPLPEWIRTVPILKEGSKDLARASGEAASINAMLIWMGHGIVAMTSTLTDARSLIEKAMGLVLDNTV